MAAAVEDVAAGWLAELLGLPEGVSSGFVTGAQGANTTALAAARQHVLAAAGWDVAARRAQRAPRASASSSARERHVTIDRSLRLLGLGTASLELVPADDQGRMRADALARRARGEHGPTIVCAQAGNVNTGAFDPLAEIADACEDAGAWLHVDGAFGLWAAASPRFRHLVAGVERADSWAIDAHKWLNVPYDSGVVFCRHPDAQAERHGRRGELSPARRAAAARPTGCRSRRAERAASRSGRRCARSAATASRSSSTAAASTRARFASLLGAEPGVEILNEVVLNQVLVRFGDDDEVTREVVRARPGGRHVLARRNGLARQGGDADLGLELPDDDRGRRAVGGGDPRRVQERGGEPIEERWTPSG